MLVKKEKKAKRMITLKKTKREGKAGQVQSAVGSFRSPLLLTALLVLSFIYNQ